MPRLTDKYKTQAWGRGVSDYAHESYRRISGLVTGSVRYPAEADQPLTLAILPVPAHKREDERDEKERITTAVS